jgi:hypothetical protein
MSCSLVEMYRYFIAMYHLHPQGSKSKQAKSKVCLLRLFFDPEDGGYMFARNIDTLIVASLNNPQELAAVTQFSPVLYHDTCELLRWISPPFQLSYHHGK